MPSRSSNGTNKRSEEESNDRVSPPVVRHFKINAAAASAAHLMRGRGYCTSSDSNSDSDSDNLADLAQNLTENIQDLEEIASSLKRGRQLHEENVTKSKRMCKILANQDLPDLKWVVEDVAKRRSQENEGIDPAGQQVKSVLNKINTTKKTVDLMLMAEEEREPDALESEARAAELKNLLKSRIIPAVREIIVAYKELKAATAEKVAEKVTDDESDSSGDSPIEGD